MTKPLNLDEVRVISLRPLNDGTFEALLKVSGRDRERLFQDHAAMAYSIHPWTDPDVDVARISKDALDNLRQDWLNTDEPR